MSSVGPSPNSGTPWQHMLGNCFCHVVLSHWIVSDLILNCSATRCLWVYGLLWSLWQTLAGDGAHATCFQQFFSWQCLLTISIMWHTAFAHTLDDQFGGHDYDNACFCFCPWLRWRSAWIGICNLPLHIIALEFARIRLSNFDWLSHLQLLLHPGTKEPGGKLAWFRTHFRRAKGQHLPHLSLQASTESHRKVFSCLWLFCCVFFVGFRGTIAAWLISICVRPTLALLAVNVFQHMLGTRQRATSDDCLLWVLLYCAEPWSPWWSVSFVGHRACAAAGPCFWDRVWYRQYVSMSNRLLPKLPSHYPTESKSRKVMKSATPETCALKTATCLLGFWRWWRNSHAPASNLQGPAASCSSCLQMSMFGAGSNHDVVKCCPKLVDFTFQCISVFLFSFNPFL